MSSSSSLPFKTESYYRNAVFVPRVSNRENAIPFYYPSTKFPCLVVTTNESRRTDQQRKMYVSSNAWAKQSSVYVDPSPIKPVVLRPFKPLGPSPYRPAAPNSFGPGVVRFRFGTPLKIMAHKTPIHCHYMPMSSPLPIDYSMSSNIPRSISTASNKPEPVSLSLTLPAPNSDSSSLPIAHSMSSNILRPISTSSPQSPRVNSKTSNMPMLISTSPPLPRVDSMSSNIPKPISMSSPLPVPKSKSSKIPRIVRNSSLSKSKSTLSVTKFKSWKSLVTKLTSSMLSKPESNLPPLSVADSSPSLPVADSTPSSSPIAKRLSSSLSVTKSKSWKSLVTKLTSSMLSKPEFNSLPLPVTDSTPSSLSVADSTPPSLPVTEESLPLLLHETESPPLLLTESLSPFSTVAKSPPTLLPVVKKHCSAAEKPAPLPDLPPSDEIFEGIIVPSDDASHYWAQIICKTENPDVFNPFCQCGGGSYLGKVWSIPMFENHRAIDCIVNPPKSQKPYLSSSYFNILLMFESSQIQTSFEDEILNLLQIWKKCCNMISSDPCAGTNVLIHYAVSHSASLILCFTWENIQVKIKTEFSSAIEQILNKLKTLKCHPEAIKSCRFLLSIIKHPWNHHFLPKLLYGNPSQEEVLDFIRFEKSNVFLMRINILFEDKCVDLALKLSSLAMNLKDLEIKNSYYFKKEDFRCIRDIYYASLEKMNKRKELIHHLSQYSPYNEGQTLLAYYLSYIKCISNLKKEERPRICDCIVTVHEMAACTMISNALKDPNFVEDFIDLFRVWTKIMITLIESDLQTNINYLLLKVIVRKFVEVAPTPYHLYAFCDILSDEFGEKLPRSFYLELYIKALAFNINEKEKCRLLGDKSKGYNLMILQVQGYLKMANLLDGVLSVCRECILSAYCLMPSDDLMNKLEEMASLSGKIQATNENKESISDVNHKTFSEKHDWKVELEEKILAYTRGETYLLIHSDLNKLQDPLSKSMHDNLINVLRFPRFGHFNWIQDWSSLKRLCERYLTSLDTIINRTILKRSELKYIDMDVDDYNQAVKQNLRSITIEKDNFSSDKGYFSSDSSDDNEPQTSIATSDKFNGQSNCGLHQKRTGSPHCSEIYAQEHPKDEFSRSHINFDETDDFSVDSLINEKSLSNYQHSNNEVENNISEELVLKEMFNNSKKSFKISELPQKECKQKRAISSNQHDDFDYSWCPRKKGKHNKDHLLLKENQNHKISLKSFNEELKINERLNRLSERVPQLSSLDFIMPVNTDHIVNVVQIQTSTNVSQTQTEHVSNHSNNEIEKKSNDNQTNSHSLDDFVSVYPSDSLNNSNQHSGIYQGECSFTGSVSVSNQRIVTDTVSNTQDLQDTSKSSGTSDVVLDQNQINFERQCWNNNQSHNSGEQLPTTVENAVLLSSNVIVRTSDIKSSSTVTKTSDQTTNTAKKSSTYCVKTRNQFLESISSISTNINCSSTPAVLNSSKSNFDSKSQQNSSVQTSIGLQVNFTNQKSENIKKISPISNQHSQISTSIAENSTLTNVLSINNQITNPNNRPGTTSFTKENTSIDNLKSNMTILNPVSSIQTQTCIGLRSLNDVSNPNASVISLMIASTQSQVIKSNVQNALYTSAQNQRVQLTDLSHTNQINRSDEQNKIDNIKLKSQTFTATSEAIKFVTSSTESQRLIQSTEKNNASNLSIFQNTTDGVSNLSQQNDRTSKPLNRGRGNMRTYESKTRALKQANMSDMFVFEKGTLYAVQDDVVNQVEPTKPVTSPRNTSTSNIKVPNRQIKESNEKPKLSPNASPNVTITGSMLPRFQQVFGKTKFQSSSVINENSSLCSTSIASNSSNPGSAVNRTNILTSRVCSSSKGVQTNHDIAAPPINSNSMNCVPPKLLDNNLQQNMNVIKASNIMAVGNNKNNVITPCKTVSSDKNVPQNSSSSSNQLLTSNIDTNNTVKKEFTGTPISKISSTFTTSSNNSLTASSNPNVVYSVPVQTDSKTNNNIENSSQGVTQIQRQLKISPSITQTVLSKHPSWQQNCFRQGKQSTEVHTSSAIERLISSNVDKINVESSNNKITISPSKPNVSESNSLMIEQMREFESVLEEVRLTSLMNERSTSSSMLPHINNEIIQIHSPTENVDLLSTDSNQALFPLNKKSDLNSEGDHSSFSFLGQTLANDLSSEEKEPVTIPSSLISVPSVTPTPPVTSPNNSNVSVNPVDGSKQIVNKGKPVIKTPANSPSTSTVVKVPVLQKPLPKLQEDEQTTQRIYAILDKYAEQLRNSPELKNKPAPRRRTNPPTNPSMNPKRKKSNQLNLKTCSQQTSCSSSGMEMSPTSDVQAIDSDDSSNAVSHFSHIMNSPPRNSDEQSTATVISETQLIESSLINEVVKKINVDTEIKSKVSQSTQIVVSGTSGSFLSIPEGSSGNVRLLVAAGKNQKMYRLHCPVGGPGPVLFHQITAKDSCSNDVKMSSNILGQNINDSNLLSALTADDLQVANSGLGNEILMNASQNSTAFDHKIKKSDIILESMEKAQVIDKNEKQLPYPVMKKSQASQSTFSVIHTLPCKPKLEPIDSIELISESQNNISENIQKNFYDNAQNNSNNKQELISRTNIDQIIHHQEIKNKCLKEDPSFIPPVSSKNTTSIPFKGVEFPSFHSKEVKQTNLENTTSINEKNSQQNASNLIGIKTENTNTNQISISCTNDKKISNAPNNLHMIECQKDITNYQKDEQNKPNIVLSNVAVASAAEIISNANQPPNTYKEKEVLSPKNGKAECESENENENTLSNTVYNLLDNQSTNNMNTKIGLLTHRLKNDKSPKNWNNCLSKIIPIGTEKMLEGENLNQLQESFQHAKIKTFKDLKIFVFEQCKKFDNNVETLKEYDLYDDIDGLGVDKPCTNELFPEVAILNDLDKSVSPTLGLLQASTSKSNDNCALQARRKSVLSHTTTSTVIPPGVEQSTNAIYKKIKSKVSFLKQALYNEMHQDSNDSETKPFINGNSKTVLELNEQSDSCPESPSNTAAIDSETCMSEDSTSTISSGTPHYNFRKSKRKYIEEDGFIESQVIKRMYRGRTSDDSEEKSEPHKINHQKVLTPEQKTAHEKKKSTSRRISSRLKTNNVKNNQHVTNKSPQLDSPQYKVTTTRASLRRVSRKTT